MNIMENENITKDQLSSLTEFFWEQFKNMRHDIYLLKKELKKRDYRISKIEEALNKQFKNVFKF